MLPSNRRLTKNGFDSLSDFKRQIFSSDNFTLKIYFSGSSPSCFAVVLSSKVFKKSVERNKKRRQIKSIILKKLDSFREGFAVVVYPQKGARNERTGILEEDLSNLFKKSGILK